MMLTESARGLLPDRINRQQQVNAGIVRADVGCDETPNCDRTCNLLSRISIVVATNVLEQILQARFQCATR